MPVHPYEHVVQMYGMQGTPSPEERRRDVLAATLRLIARGGVDSIRYREVATEAGVPLGTVQYHFASREALLRAAFAHFLDENTRALYALRDSFAARRIAEVADFVIETIRADFVDPSARVLAEYELVLYAARDPEIAAALAAWEQAMATQLAGVLASLGVASAAALARTLIEIIRGYQLVHLGRRDAGAGADLDDLRRRLLDLLRNQAVKGKSHAPHHQAR